MTMGEWLEYWLSVYVCGPVSGLAPSTQACYARAVAAVPDALRQVPLSALSALDIMPWIVSVAAVHPRAAQLDRVMLSIALRIAAKMGLCSPGIIDPDTCPMPRHKPREAAILAANELRLYMATAQWSPCAPVLMLCACGLRRGEAWGMRWDAVDMGAGTVSVLGQRVGDELRPPKTASGRRCLRMPRMLADVLRVWPHSSDWVCDVPLKRVYAAHQDVLRLAGLPAVTLHGLRHSYATAAVGAGVPVKLVQYALGHAHYDVTADIYAHHPPAVSEVCCGVYD